MQSLSSKALGAFLITLGLNSCGLNSVEHDLRLANNSDFGAFSDDLSAEYLALADRLEGSDDSSKQLSFYLRRKALFSSNQKYVLPSNIAEGPMDGKDPGELLVARSSLIATLDGGARQACPRKAASTQVLFDCMVLVINSAQSSEWCRKGFLGSLDSLERSCQQSDHLAD